MPFMAIGISAVADLFLSIVSAADVAGRAPMLLASPIVAPLVFTLNTFSVEF